jgi:Flp pilus assembly protein TadG
VRPRHPDRARRGEDGYAAVLVAIVVAALFFPLAAIAVDVSRWYLEGERLQKAADAAALAGVTHMPQDLPAATGVARDVSSRNGYAHGGSTSVSTAPGERPGQLRVTVARTVPNTFGAMLGVGETTVSRTALADYSGPQPMGSPCNTFGNEPPGSLAFPPVTSVLAAPPGASCERYPELWPSVAGPEAAKTQGDQFNTRYCSSGESACEGSSNDEFVPTGTIFMVRVQEAAVNSRVRVQVYDPAYVATGSECGSLPASLSNQNNDNTMNDYVTDGRRRYDDSANEFCSGDNQNAGPGQRRGQERPPVTSFIVRGPTDDYNPLSGEPLSGCVRQYPGYGVPTENNLRKGRTQYDDDLARVFHQWKNLCSFQPTEAGDYYLQVRTNVPLQGEPNDDGSYLPANAAASLPVTQAGHDPSVTGNGTNRFAFRAFIDGGSNAALSVSAWQNMPIFANTSSSTPEFNLVRVLPAAAGKTLQFTFFDVGDAATSGTMTVLRPNDATGSPLSNCQASGFVNRSLPTCSLSGISNSTGWNGQAETITVPIPTDYSCNYDSPGGCWFRVRVSFGTGSVTDATTWSASVSGDPVRLVE